MFYFLNIFLRILIFFWVVVPKMEAVSSSETLAYSQNTTWHDDPEDHLYSQCCENLKSYILLCVKEIYFSVFLSFSFRITGFDSEIMKCSGTSFNQPVRGEP
jgi:hypothetical protein